MLSRSSWLHLRIPFSYFLLPIFLFSLAISPNLNFSRLFWVFFILHFLLYPASNGFNSYFDKDEQSIGGLQNPPPVNKGLYYLSLLLDLFAVILGLIFVNITFTLMLIGYGLVSKGYSHPIVRLKKYPIIGWLTTGVFQGLFSVIMCIVGINNFELTNITSKTGYAGLLATLMLMANYPMTQVYQHEEDFKRGDITLSLKLGIRGTFLFVGGVFGLVTLAFFFYFQTYFSTYYGYIFIVALTPVVLYFSIWTYQVFRNPSKANFSKTMWLNFISSTCLNLFFVYLFLHDRNFI